MPGGLQGRRGSRGNTAAAMGGLKDELLKAIWHAFTALDLDHSGKVSKSQLKVGAPPPGSPLPGLRGARSTTQGGSGTQRAVTTGRSGPECRLAACLGRSG